MAKKRVKKCKQKIITDKCGDKAEGENMLDMGGKKSLLLRKRGKINQKRFLEEKDAEAVNQKTYARIMKENSQNGTMKTNTNLMVVQDHKVYN